MCVYVCVCECECVCCVCTRTKVCVEARQPFTLVVRTHHVWERGLEPQVLDYASLRGTDALSEM